jgi:CubicO group peptidase (beta-lactamase class C family)
MWKSLDHKSLAVIIAVSILLTGGNLWLHRGDPPLGWVTMHEFGISFDFPQNVPMSINTPPGWDQNYWSGAVQGEDNSAMPEMIGIFWTTGTAATKEEGLISLLEMAKQETTNLNWDEMKSKAFGDYDAAYIEITITEGEIEVPGIIAAFYDPYGRLMMPYHLGFTGSDLNNLEKLKKIVKTMKFDEPDEPYVLESYWPTEGWRYVTPAQAGMDGEKLRQMVDAIEGSSFKVDSAMVIKDGYIVLDEYFGEYEKDTLHIIYSCTKSVVSTIFGIAHENGAIPDLDTKLLDIFPEIIPENPGDWKSTITLRDLLMMSGGFDARDSWLYEWEGLNPLHESEDAVQYMLNLPMDFEPGSRFEYTNGVSHLLSCIITEKTGVSAAEYADEHLFGPLGITEYTWDSDNQGRNWGYNRIHFTPHDMAKIGFLFLNKGDWDGEQIISEEWVAEATTHRIDANILDGYGYQWWVGDGFYVAVGYQGQFIFVYPEHDLIAVFTGGSPETFDYTIRLPELYIIPALN